MLPERNPVDPTTGWRVWGQPAAVRKLQAAAHSGPSHAYLFTGPPKSGRLRAALAFAAALSCPTPIGPMKPCGACNVCMRMDRGTFPDVTVVNLATQAERDRDKSKNQSLNIATVREIRGAVAYRPSEAAWRIVIVDDVETMQETAQEAFLKTLEEPPSYTIVILISADADRVLDTIRSRCIEIPFGRSPDAAVQQALVARGVALRPAADIAHHAGGSIGWAIEAASDGSVLERRVERLALALDMVHGDAYSRMIRSVALADGWTGDRSQVLAQLEALLDLWRRYLLDAHGVDVGEIESGSPFRALPANRLVDAVRSVEQCRANLEANVRPRLALETMIGVWPQFETHQ